MIYFDITKLALKSINKLQVHVRFQKYHYCCISIQYSDSKEMYGFNMDNLELLKSNYFVLFFSLLYPILSERTLKVKFIEAIK